MPDYGGDITSLGEFNALLEIGLSEVFTNTIETHPKLYQDIIVERKAKEYVEDELLVTGFGPMPEKPVGGTFVVDKPFISPEKRFRIVPHGLSYVAEYELIRWDKYAVFGPMTKQLARSGVDRKNILGYAPLNNGFSTADAVYTTYNGEALFSAAHVLLRHGTGKNAPTVAVDLSYHGMIEAETDFSLIQNEDGLYALMAPSTVVCHPSKKWIADTLLKSEYRPDNANMSYNAVGSQGYKSHSSPYLTSANAWFFLADKKRLKISLDIGDDLTLRRDFEHQTLNQTYNMYCSLRVRVLHWHGVWGSQGT